MTESQFSIAIQTVTLVAIILAAWQLLFHSKQMHRDFEVLYVQRYWDLMDKRSFSFSIDQVPSDGDRVVIRGYLQLCEDEIDLRRLGRVSDNTWGFWGGAILSQVSANGYREEFERSSKHDYPMLSDLIGSGGNDPLKHRWLWRKSRGL